MVTLDPPLITGQTVALSGTATPGATVAAVADSDTTASVDLGSAGVGSDGRWAIFYEDGLALGIWSIHATETYSASSSAQTTITITPPDLLIVEIRFASGLHLLVAEDVAQPLDSYHDPKGRFVIERSVFVVPEIRGGYALFFNRHTDGSRETVEFTYGDTNNPVPLIGGYTNDYPCVITTKLAHGLHPNDRIQCRSVAAPSLNAKDITVASIVSPTQIAVSVDTTEEAVYRTGGWIVPGNLGPHTVTISRGGKVLYEANLPQHIYMGQWRWQSEPLPREGDVASLVKSGALPHYNMTDLPLTMYRGASKFTYTPMGLAGLCPFQGQTGERNDIGPITGWTAECFVDPTMLDTVFAQAEAFGSFPWCERDLTACAPFDALSNPEATHYANTANPPAHYVPIAACRTPSGGSLGPDMGHCPNLSYVPWCLTGDPYYLLQMQLEVMYWLVASPPTARYNLDGRYCAWTLRAFFLAALSTPDAELPTWLHSKEYMQQALDNYHTRIQSLQDPTPLSPIHLTGDGGGSQDRSASMMAGSYVATWTDDFIVIVEAWITEHYPEWMPDLIWKIENTIQRTNGTSGWNPAQPSQYSSAVRPSCRTTEAINSNGTPKVGVGSVVGFDMKGTGAEFPIQIDLERMRARVVDAIHLQLTARAIDGTKAAAHNTNRVVWGDCYVATYGDWWRLNQVVQPDKCNQSTTVIDTTRVNMDYTGYVLSALAYGANHEIAGALAAYNKLHGMAKAKLGRSWHWARKFSITPQ